jgi:CxxC motif-containing protein (DUF1111 family)
LSLTVASTSGHADEPPQSPESNPPATAAVLEQKPANEARSPATARASGREIFLREWIPNDPRSHGGDGLGPVFNESSCVSCHNQGGVGGGGSEAKNVIVISAVRSNQNGAMPQRGPQAVGGGGGRGRNKPAAVTAPKVEPPVKVTDESAEASVRRELLEDLRRLHPGLATSRSVVLHNSGTDPNYTSWRDRVLGLNVGTMASQMNGPFAQAVPAVPADAGFFATLVAKSEQEEMQEKLPPLELQAEKLRGLMTRVMAFQGRMGMRQQPGVEQLKVAAIPTQRNSTALFGVGLIDSIPDTVLEAAARTIDDFPEISGRVARLKDGRIGRFGWKAQKANLYDFTMTACAVELGLHVPDHPQAGVPLQPDYQPAGFDLNREECRDLVQFLRDLPAPTRRVEQTPAIANELKTGELAFAKIGCAACHTAELGAVNGIFSDLLLHDLGPEGADNGSYGVFQPQSSGNDAEDPLSGLLTDSGTGPIRGPFGNFGSPDSLSTEEELSENMIGAGRQEWRTPPLWGVRDSAPYMHDGRAGTLDQAIAFHGGEAQLSANRFFRLTPEERTSVLTFLRSLVAPDMLASALKDVTAVLP